MYHLPREAGRHIQGKREEGGPPYPGWCIPNSETGLREALGRQEALCAEASFSPKGGLEPLCAETSSLLREA